MWDLIVSVPDHCLSFYFTDIFGRGFAQMPLYLNHGETYYTTVRGITYAGKVLESFSNGLIVDQTPGKISFDK